MLSSARSQFARNRIEEKGCLSLRASSGSALYLYPARRMGLIKTGVSKTIHVVWVRPLLATSPLRLSKDLRRSKAPNVLFRVVFYMRVGKRGFTRRTQGNDVRSMQPENTRSYSYDNLISKSI